MARPTKQGIDYFPLDVQFDDNMELYLLEHEAIGLSVFVTTLQLIYQNEGYYCKNGKDFHLLIKKRINVDTNKINDCINSLIDRGIFNAKLHKQYEILTSSGIQKRFFDAAKRKKTVYFIPEILLICVNDYDNVENVDINEQIVCNNATKEKGKGKVKEKVNVNKNFVVNADIEKPSNPEEEKPTDKIPSLDEFIEYGKKYAVERYSKEFPVCLIKLKDTIESCYDYWEERNWMRGKEPVKDWQKTLQTWLRKSSTSLTDWAKKNELDKQKAERSAWVEITKAPREGIE